MGRKWNGYYQNRILAVLPIDGEKVKSKEIYAGARIPRAYVAKYLNELREKGIIERIQESRKNVYYRRCENVRLVAMINSFLAELQIALSYLPEPERDFKKILEKTKIELTEEEISYFDKKSFLKGYILVLLILKANDLLRNSIPELKKFKYYMLISESDLQIIPQKLLRLTSK